MAMNSSEIRIPSDLSADRPGNDPSSDRLGYAPFAKRLAQSIARLSRAEGHVVALYGAWGFGKTTMLNYVRYYLNEMGASERPIIVTYNPWWFSGHEDLVRAFFSQLRAKVEDQKEFPSEVRSRLADFADALSEVPLPYLSWGKLAGRVLRPKPKDIEKLKCEISTSLRAQPHRILVMIDDIDRLTSEEIRQVFRAVKSVGDFPNVTYLMAFDKRVVARSLGELQGGSGEDYLEKIVQIPFELPLVDRVSIRALFFEQVDMILKDVDRKSFDQTYWGNIFLEGIDKFIETPRDVVRFTNTLAVTFRAVIGEVNPVDFIAVESLRMFRPDVYDTIKNNRGMFTGHAPDNVRHPGRDQLLQFHNNWLGRIRETSPLLEEPIKDMMQRLFPKLQAVWGNTQFGPEWEAEWRRNVRVCSDSVFPVYFSLAIPAGEISNTEMLAILANAGSAEAFGTEILNLAEQIRSDGKTKASAFLVRLQDYTATEIGIGQIEPIVSALLDIGDRIMQPEEAGAGLFDLGVDVQSGRVIWQLLKRLEAPRRYEIIREAFERGHALYLIQKAIIVLGQQQGLYGEHARPEQEWFVTREQLLELDRMLVGKIRQASQDGSLLNTPRLLLVLNFWCEKGGLDEARAWVAGTVTDDRKLAEFLERCLHGSSSFSFGDAVGRKHDRLDPNWLKAYLDADEIVSRVRNLSQSVSISDRQRRAVNQFLKEYDFRKRGGNPDDPFAQDHIA
jgi:predicted KAP-like P-loop ATPase